MGDPITKEQDQANKLYIARLYFLYMCVYGHHLSVWKVSNFESFQLLENEARLVCSLDFDEAIKVMSREQSIANYSGIRKDIKQITTYHMPILRRKNRESKQAGRFVSTCL